jgi:NADH-quinone oxidoreductase B subunit
MKPGSSLRASTTSYAGPEELAVAASVRHGVLAIEFMGVVSSKFDISRFGAELVRFSPRQSDMILVAGTINYKLAPVLKRIYDQIAEPKYVISMAPVRARGLLRQLRDVQGIDQIIPVDVFIPGCPPRPEAILDAIMKLQERIDTEPVASPRTSAPPRSGREDEGPLGEQERHRTSRRVGCEVAREVGGAVLDVDRSLSTIARFTVDRKSIHDVLAYLKNEHRFNLLLDIAGVDCMNLPTFRERFELAYILYSVPDDLRVRIEIAVPELDMDVPTVTDMWKSANWGEREAFEMFGFNFVGHPCQKRLLTHHEFVGFPLRKDYPVMGGQCAPARPT